MDAQRRELDIILIEYNRQKAELLANIDFMQKDLMRELDKTSIPCYDKMELCGLLERILETAEVCRKMYVHLMNAGHPPPGKPLEDKFLYNE